MQPSTERANPTPMPQAVGAAAVPATPLPDDGFVWMTHPSRMNGRPIPVWTYIEDGVRYYVPFEEGTGEYEWDERSDEWRVVASPSPASTSAPDEPAAWGEREFTQILEERDRYQKWADKLAAAIAEHFGVDIGEHSSSNNPWREALDAFPAEGAPDAAPSERHEKCRNGCAAVAFGEAACEHTCKAATRPPIYVFPDAAPVGEPQGQSTLREDAMYAMGYQHGAKDGWNFCVRDDHDGFARTQASTEHVRVLRDTRATPAGAAPVGEPAAYLSGDGMRAIPAEEFDAYLAEDAPKGMAEYIREKFTVPLYRATPTGVAADESTSAAPDAVALVRELLAVSAPGASMDMSEEGRARRYAAWRRAEDFVAASPSGERTSPGTRATMSAAQHTPGPQRPTEEAARAAIEAWLAEHAPGYPDYSMCEDGDDGWAFWIATNDTTSYLHHDMRIEWYGTGWPDFYTYDGDTGMWSEVASPSGGHTSAPANNEEH